MREGSKRARYSRSAGIIICGAKCEARCEGQAKHGRELRAKRARAENPERHLQPHAGHGAEGLVRLDVAEERLQFQHVMRKILGRGRKVAPHRACGELVGARRAAQPEIDPPGIKRFQRAELLGDDQRRMVRQHDPARADADRLGATSDMPDHHGCRRAGDARHVVVFGQPEPLEAPGFGVLRQVERVAERLRGVAALADRGEVEHGKGDHGRVPDGICAIARLEQ